MNRNSQRRLFHEQKFEPTHHKINSQRVTRSIEKNNFLANSEKRGQLQEVGKPANVEIIQRIEQLRKKCSRIVLNKKTSEQIVVNNYLNHRSLNLSTIQRDQIVQYSTSRNSGPSNHRSESCSIANKRYGSLDQQTNSQNSIILAKILDHTYAPNKYNKEMRDFI